MRENDIFIKANLPFSMRKSVEGMNDDYNYDFHVSKNTLYL